MNQNKTSTQFRESTPSLVRMYSLPGLQSGRAKFLTVDTNLLVFIDFGEIGLVFIASLSYVWTGYHAKASVEAARQIKQE